MLASKLFKILLVCAVFMPAMTFSSQGDTKSSIENKPLYNPDDPQFKATQKVADVSTGTLLLGGIGAALGTIIAGAAYLGKSIFGVSSGSLTNYAGVGAVGGAIIGAGTGIYLTTRPGIRSEREAHKKAKGRNIFGCAAADDVDGLKALYNLNQNIDFKTMTINSGKTPFHIAAANGSEKALALMLSTFRPAYVTMQNGTEQTYSSVQIRNNESDIDWERTNKNEIDVQDDNLNTPLHDAAANKQWRTAALLQAYGANPTLTNRLGVYPRGIISCDDINHQCKLAMELWKQGKFFKVDAQSTAK